MEAAAAGDAGPQLNANDGQDHEHDGQQVKDVKERGHNAQHEHDHFAERWEASQGAKWAQDFERAQGRQLVERGNEVEQPHHDDERVALVPVAAQVRVGARVQRPVGYQRDEQLQHKEDVEGADGVG